MRKDRVSLQSVSGDSLSVEGCADISFQLNRLTLSQKFYVVNGMNRNVILGQDWLKENGVRLYYDLGCMRLGKTYVQLQEDIHISSILRISKDTTLQPQTATICHVKLNKGFTVPSSGLLTLTPDIDEKGITYIQDEPGVVLQEALTTVKDNQKLPVMIVNNTNRFLKLKRGNVIGKAEPVTPQEIANTSRPANHSNERETFQDVDVPKQYQHDVLELLHRNKDLFAKKDKDLGRTDTVKFRIDTGNHRPIKNRPYRTPLNKREVIDKAIDEMLDAKVIERSRSPWSFPLVVVDKKDGSKRMCVDFRSLNKIVTPMSVPLPLIDDILTLLGKAKHFTTLDLKSGYWQVALEEDSKEKTAFACHRGLFQFNRMPFGLSNAPAVFQELMNIVLQECEHFAIAYLDDVLIFSKTPQEHLRHIQIVFRKIREHGLRLKLKKCSFFQPETEYLGFIISDQGVKPDPKKVQAIRTLPAPTSVREIRGFIGMCSYYRRFIPNFSKIAEPLVALTKKYARFKWSEECQTAFDFLKDSLTVVPLLTYPDTNKPYVLYTDASDSCIGACLTQETDGEEKPIYYLSHKLSQTQTRWSTIEKEAFAIHYSLQKLDHYLHNATFVIRTDHKPLKYILDSPMQNKKIQLWALSLAGYNCKVEYIEGRFNCCADLLSRLPTVTVEESNEDNTHDVPDIDDRALEVGAFNSNQFRPRDFASSEAKLPDDLVKPHMDLPDSIDIEAEQDKDPEIIRLKARLGNGKATKTEQEHFLMIDKAVYYLSNADAEDPKLRLYIPESLEEMVTKQYHDFLGHMAVDKSYDTMRQKYYFPSMYKKLHAYIDRCVTCQTRSHKDSRPELQNTEIPPYPFAKIALDLSGPYPQTLSGNKYIVSFIDVYSGWPEAFSVPDKSADNIVQLLLEEIFPRFGCPLEIVTDNGTENVNKAVRETLEAMNIHHVKTSYYSPQSNGKVERFHRTMVDVMAKKIQENVQTWDLYLNQTLAAIRFHTSEPTKTSPFFLLYNRDVVLPLDTILKPRRRYQGEDLHKIALEQQHKSFTSVHRHLKQAKKKQKEYVDRTAKEETIQVGDPVYLRNHRRKSKLDNKWTPYYRVVEQTGPVSFKVRNQLTGDVTKAHARHLRLANLDEWSLPKENLGRPLRKSTYVVPPEESEDDSDVQEEPALEKVIKRTRKERSDSEDEDDIPLMELRKRLLAQKQREAEVLTSDDEVGRENEEVSNDIADIPDSARAPVTHYDSDTEVLPESESDDPMEIDFVKKPRKKRTPLKQNTKHKQVSASAPRKKRVPENNLEKMLKAFKVLM